MIAGATVLARTIRGCHDGVRINAYLNGSLEEKTRGH